MNFANLGFVRAAAVAPEVRLAQPLANAAGIIAHLEQLAPCGVAVAVFPELCVTGYSCEDLLPTGKLLTDCQAALARIAEARADIVAVVGAPWASPDGRLFNCAVVIANGGIVGMVPKTAPPNHGEFYERRWFASGADVDLEVNTALGRFRICPNQLFEVGLSRFAIEICEDLWAPQPPGAAHCLAGADLILNPSASNELVAKADYRRDLVRMASGQWLCGYLYAGAGMTESSKDMVFGGHLMAAENGRLLRESERFRLNATTLTADFDIDRLRRDRLRNATFAQAARTRHHHVTALATAPAITELERTHDAHPFVPKDESEFDARARDILGIQAGGLSRRLLATTVDKLVVGVSGGLDSTLAVLVGLDSLHQLDLPRAHLHALSMPGPGTTERTRSSALQLAQATGIVLREIPIDTAVGQHLGDLGHTAEDDVVFENAQARERTQLLFDYANRAGGIVVGTGDLSELALGWCTFNADHMASYNVNAGVPKTLVSYLVRWYARHRASTELAAVLERVLNTPISPELIAPQDGRINQETEAIIGPYELHDFFLYHTVRDGFEPIKIYELARLAFHGSYDSTAIKRWLKVFLERFFSQQFKRTTLPPGPKVGTVSLSPRGDWRMPDEVSAASLVAEVDSY